MSVNGQEAYFAMYNRAIVYASQVKFTCSANTNDDTTISPIYFYCVPMYWRDGIGSLDSEPIHNILDMNQCKWDQVTTGADALVKI